MKIYVSNLDYSVQNEDLQDAFSAFGTVTSANVINDRETGRSRGFGFVEMENADEANAAINNLNGSDLNGRQLRVAEAQDKPKTGNGGGFKSNNGYSRNNNRW